MDEGLVVVTVLGKDKKGLVSGITGLLADDNINIFDIEQNVIHGLFSMFMLVDTGGDATKRDEIKKKLSLFSKEQELDISVTPFKEQKIKIRSDDERDLNIITVLGKDRPGVAAAVSKSLYKLGINIEQIRMIARGELVAMEILADSKGKTELTKLRQSLANVGRDIDMDIIVQPENISRWRKRLVVFDMDGTIIDAEIIDELGKVAGVGEEVSRLTAKGMRGEMSFEESLRERVKMLKGLPIEVLQRIRDNMKVTVGGEELIMALKDMGYKLALISGGFTYFTDALKDRLGFDYTYANELVIKDGKLTGEISGDIIDSRKKAEIMEELARKENISKEDIVAIGDGANDKIMIENAGLGIAFNAKDILKKVADGNITKNNLKGLMYCLGMNDRYMKSKKIKL